MKQKFTLALVSLICLNSLALYSSPARAQEKACAPTQELSLKESDAIHMFHSRLSHLLDYYGTPNFEAQLSAIAEKSWPQTKLIQVSPSFFEQAQNMVDQERLKDSIARTIGLDTPAWDKFDRQMRSITLMEGSGADLANPFDASARNLILAIKDKQLSSADGAEAILRVTSMYIYLLQKISINNQVLQDRASVDAKKLAVLSVGLVGGAVLGSTLVISAPIVTGAGAAVGGLSTNPVVAALLVKVAEAAAGSAIGFFGAPAAVLVDDSFQTLSHAGQQSANLQTNYACELSRQMAAWKVQAPERLLSASLTGAGMGAAGGALTFTSFSAKLVLYGTGVGVGVAQLYAVGKMSQTTLNSIGYYHMAEEAEAQGQHDKALEYLFKSRELAAEAQEQALQNIIIGSLSYHVTNHFMGALREGESAIRQLYAASADTIPTAVAAAGNMVKAVAASTSTATSGH